MSAKLLSAKSLSARGRTILAASVCLLLLGWGSTAGSQEPNDDLRINQIQALGSHNSFHIEPQPVLYDTIEPIAGTVGFDASDLLYTHSPLQTQFESEGIRQIELDIFADPDGGKYSNPAANLLAFFGTPGFVRHDHPELDEPGMKVLHIQDFDYETTCLTFIQCLTEVKAFSDSHPWHAPIAILVEHKQDILPDPGTTLFDFVEPLPFTADLLDDVDDEIRSVFGPDQLITPDDVRGSAATLEEAVLTSGWPTLGDSRGKIMFLMDNGGSVANNYIAGHPSLQGRVMFTPSEPGRPEAAFVKVNDPNGANFERIQNLVDAGYIVRTRADTPNHHARTGDRTQQELAFASGAQFVSTDYPVPGRATRFGTDYVAELPGGYVVRCNPISAPADCVSALLEVEPPPTTTTTTTTVPDETTTTTTLPEETQPTIHENGPNPDGDNPDATQGNQVQGRSAAAAQPATPVVVRPVFTG